MSINQTDLLGGLLGMKRDKQSVTADWESLQQIIDGVAIRQVRTVLKDGGALTELYRDHWENGGEVRHVFQEVLSANTLTAWHIHQETTDRLFVSIGNVKIVLYDAREGSRTRGLLNVFRFGTARPALVIIPPCIWHGIMNVGSTDAVLLNLTDKPYEYENPDHWKLPSNTDQIPYSFNEDF
jgi:dTDP-4-dehydrorhamnose 3,5-epimerase